MKHNSELAVVFDLGNVLLPINLELTYQAFANLSEKLDSPTIKKLIEDGNLWYLYEKGLESDVDFRANLKNQLNLKASDEEFDLAFKALLIEIPDDSLKLLDYCRRNFKELYLLSNTSSIHANEYLKKDFSRGLFDYFDKIFLSFEINQMKPEKEIYHYLKKSINKDYEEIVFFDDNLRNIESAKELGMKAFLVDPFDRINSIMTVIQHL